MSQQAAEEIFAGVRDRVNRMGGVRGVRERERERGVREREEAREDGRAARGAVGEEGEGEEDGDGERGNDWGGEWEREGREEGEGDGDGDGGEREEKGGLWGEDDEGYTMDMMLKSLNIELGVIGFDREGQRWVD